MLDPRRLFVLCLAASALLGDLVAQRTWTVEADGSGDFLDIQPAVQAAAEGDRIVVGRGAFSPFVVDGKGLTLVGARVFQSGFTPGGTESIVVRNLAAHQRVVLIDPFAFQSRTPRANLLLENCAGAVWIEGLFSDSYGATALEIDSCADVVLWDCFLQTNAGRADANGNAESQPGMAVRDATVHAYDCAFRGSHSVLQGPNFPVNSGPVAGGHGIHAVDARLVLRGGRADGGGGSGVASGSCLFSGAGGDGIRLDTRGGTPPDLTMQDVAVAGAAAGFFTCGTAGSPGQDVRVLAGTSQVLPGVPRSLTAPGLLDAPGDLVVGLSGLSGESVVVLAALPGATTPFAGTVLHVAAPFLTLGSTVVGPTRIASLQVTVPAVSVALPTLALQAAFVDAGGQLELSNPAALVIR